MTFEEVYRTALWATGWGPWFRPAPGDNPLVDVERFVSRRWPAVPSITPGNAAGRLLAGDRDLLVVDARETDEYAVSHVPGALRLDPVVGPPQALEILGSDVAGRDVLVYCSVGIRSARLLSKLHVPLRASGARNCINLTGGIFRWYHEGHPLHLGEQGKRRVHGYDEFWSRFLIATDKQ